MPLPTRPETTDGMVAPTEPIEMKEYEEQIIPLLRQIAVIYEEHNWEFYAVTAFGGKGNSFVGYHVSPELRRINPHLIDRAERGDL